MSIRTFIVVSACTFLFAQGFAAEPYKVVRVRDGGAVIGSVIIAGKAPQLSRLPVTKDDKICGAPRPCERLIVGKNSGIMNCVVTLEGITRGKAFPKGKKFELDQQHCDYVPHLLVISPPDELTIVNRDPVLHNVHCYDKIKGGSTVFNIAQPIKGQRTPVTKMLPVGGKMFFASCDAGHPWMSAYIMMADNPYFAITNAKGEFRLDDIPPGTYTVRVWHEGVAVIKTEMEGGKPKKYIFEDPYTLEQTVSVTGKSNTRVDFSLPLRTDS